MWGSAADVGATAVLAASRTAYRLLTLAGALYLMGMGVTMLWRSRPGRAQGPGARQSGAVDEAQERAAAEVPALFVEAAEAGLVSDGMIAQSEAQRQAFWQSASCSTRGSALPRTRMTISN